MLIELTTCSSRVSTATEERTGEEEELLLNTVAACTNITFYACKVRTLRLSLLLFLVMPLVADFADPLLCL